MNGFRRWYWRQEDDPSAVRCLAARMLVFLLCAVVAGGCVVGIHYATGLGGFPLAAFDGLIVPFYLGAVLWLLRSSEVG